MEADFQRVYHLDLMDVLTEPIRWQRLLHLVRHLPADAATVVEVSGLPVGAWSRDQQLLAVIAEHVDALIRVMVRAWSDPKKGKRATLEPLRIEWPGRDTAKPIRKAATPAEMARFFRARSQVQVIREEE